MSIAMLICEKIVVLNYLKVIHLLINVVFPPSFSLIFASAYECFCKHVLHTHIFIDKHQHMYQQYLCYVNIIWTLSCNWKNNTKCPMKRSSKGNEAVFKYNKISSLSIKNYFGLVESEWKKRYYDPERSFKGK